MTVPVRLGLFLVALVAAVGIGAAIGSVVPDQGGNPDTDHGTGETGHAAAAGHSPTEAPGSANLLGLPSAVNGYRIDVYAVAADRNEPTPVPLGTEADGYEMTLVETPTTNPDDPVAVTVERDGDPVRNLEPYLGSAGHTVFSVEAAS